jgi:hypothetical protein
VKRVSRKPVETETGVAFLGLLGHFMFSGSSKNTFCDVS